MNTIYGIEAERGMQSPDEEFCEVCGQWQCADPMKCRATLAGELASWAGLVDDEGDAA